MFSPLHVYDCLQYCMNSKSYIRKWCSDFQQKDTVHVVSHKELVYTVPDLYLPGSICCCISKENVSKSGKWFYTNSHNLTYLIIRRRPTSQAAFPNGPNWGPTAMARLGSNWNPYGMLLGIIMRAYLYPGDFAI